MGARDLNVVHRLTTVVLHPSTHPPRSLWGSHLVSLSFSSHHSCSEVQGRRKPRGRQTKGHLFGEHFQNIAAGSYIAGHLKHQWTCLCSKPKIHMVAQIGMPRWTYVKLMSKASTETTHFKCESYCFSQCALRRMHTKSNRVFTCSAGASGAC